jgi:hypothetical protein
VVYVTNQPPTTFNQLRTTHGAMKGGTTTTQPSLEKSLVAGCKSCPSMLDLPAPTGMAAKAPGVVPIVTTIPFGQDIVSLRNL